MVLFAKRFLKNILVCVKTVIKGFNRNRCRFLKGFVEYGEKLVTGKRGHDMEAVTFKGNKEGISMVLDCSIEFEALCQIIVQKLWQARDFLGENARLIINSKEHHLTDGEQLALKVLLQSLGHHVLRFVSTENIEVVDDHDQLPIASEVFLEIATETSQEAISTYLGGIQGAVEMYLAEGATLIIRRNLRSGQRIDFDGTLVIFGDVNAGAELTATGHILILGTMRGIAHAGSQNNRNAVVYATKLLPIQLRIADLIARAPDNEIMDTSEPEIARIIDNQLVIETCSIN